MVYQIYIISCDFHRALYFVRRFIHEKEIMLNVNYFSFSFFFVDKSLIENEWNHPAVYYKESHEIP